MVINKKDKAVVTVAIGDAYAAILDLSSRTMQHYARKIGADFVPITDMGIVGRNGFSPHWAKFNLYELFKTYSRIIYFDSDIIVREDCPDLFEMVPDTKIGAFNEGAFAPRFPILKSASEVYNISLKDPKNYVGTYFNTGVMVLSRKFRNLFHPPQEHIEFEGDYGEQTFLNLRMQAMGIDVQDIGFQFNRMTLMDKATGYDRLGSYILHYAGCPDPRTLMMVMSKDLSEWTNDAPNFDYKHRILVNCAGGLGDQIAAEPAIRFMKRNIYPNDIMYVRTPFKEVLDHLEGEIEFVTGKTNVGDKAVADFRTSPVEEDKSDEIPRFLSHPLIHPTDFASLALFRYQLPDKDKRIQLNVPQWAIDEVLGLIDADDIPNTVLIHPGKGWPSKTFPKEWWGSIIEGLMAEGKKVAIIGKYLSDLQGYEDLDCPEGCYDLRDMLTMKGMFAAIKLAPVLVTNDSAPLHAAGAFDNWIIMIPTCKHPDYLAPYRDPNNKWYKAKALYKKLTCSEIDTAPTAYGQSNRIATIDVVQGDILDYLPEPEDVVSAVIECD
jgi:ADP-heptose:LPS heptosyltransferase